MNKDTFVVLGAGKQGLAAAYHLARYGERPRVLLGDYDESRARSGADRLNSLLKKRLISPLVVDANDTRRVESIMGMADGCVSAMHFTLNIPLTQIAIAHGVHMVDMGGHTATVRAQQAMDTEARRAGVTIIPDCGMAPGFDVNLARFALAHVARPESLSIYCGGIPKTPTNPPLNYAFPFSVHGLVNECSGFADVLREGTLNKQECLVGRESVTIPRVGKLEAAYTSGGLSTAPWTFQKLFPALKTLEYKTLRYPGHWKMLEGFARKGRLEEELTQLAEKCTHDVRDLGIIHVVCRGMNRHGDPYTVVLSVVVPYCVRTGFTAMQQLTGFHSSIALLLAVRGRTPRGVLPVEMLDAHSVIDEFAREGIRVKTKSA